MTCEQFDELWRRLDCDSPTTNPLRDGVATAAELMAFLKHIEECQLCRVRSMARYLRRKGEYAAGLKRENFKAAAELRADLEERKVYDTELPLGRPNRGLGSRAWEEQDRDDTENGA